MNLLIINRDLPYFPGGGGGCTREYFINRELSQKHHITIVSNVYNDFLQEEANRLMSDSLALFYYRDDSSRNASIPNKKGTAGVISFISKIRRNWNFLRRMIGSLPAEVQFYLLIFRNMRPSLDQALSQKFYDALIIVQSDGACWVSQIPYHGPKILVCHDAKANVMRRRAKLASSWIKKVFYLWESFRYARYERRFAREFDHIVVVSEEEKRYFSDGYDSRDITVVDNGVDTHHFSDRQDEVHPLRIVFTGLMNHPPNEDAVIFFCEEILPHIVRQIPEMEFYIVGNHPTEKVRSYHDNERIFVTGYVEDVRPFLGSAAVVVVPLRMGGGTRLKILEALSMRKAVVSTGVGAEGLKYRPGEEILIADDPLEFSRKTCEVLRNPQLRNGLGNKGRTLVEREYDWTIMGRRMETVLEKARKDRVRMRIGLNCKFMYPGYAGGIEFYMRNLLEHMPKMDESTEYVIFRNQYTRDEFREYAHPNLQSEALYDRYPPSAYSGPRSWRFLKRVLKRLQWKSFHIDERNRRTVTDSGVELIHCLAGYLDPATEILPNIVTIMDLQHEYFPEFFSEEELRGRDYLWPHAAKASKAIIAISNHTQKTIVEKYGVSPDKIHVIHLAANPIYFKSPAAGKLDEVKRKYRLPSQFVFYPAFTWPHKNHIALIDALSLYARKYGSKMPLVLTGSQREAQKSVRKRIANNQLEDTVKFLGFIPTEELPALYRLSSALVFPSLFEGFGMPVLEAMASGCPVACSNVTSLPEIVGDSAVTFDPRDVEAIADAIDTLIHDKELRDHNIRVALERARLFSWEQTAAKTLQVYRETYRLLGGSV